MKAFPQLLSLHKHYNQESYIAETIEGMDLRDYFAAKAMQGSLAGYRVGDSVNLKLFADFAYKMADAMMEARNEQSS